MYYYGKIHVLYLALIRKSKYWIFNRELLMVEMRQNEFTEHGL